MAIPEELLDQIGRLEPMPVSARRLMELLGDEDVSITDVVEVLEHDAAIAANVLRAVNSASMGARRHIDNLRAAAVRLGTDRLIEVTIGAHLRTLSGDSGMYALGENELWLHSAVTAVAAREIVRSCEDREFPSSTVTAALVHDIGKLVMVRAPGVDVGELLASWDNAEGRSFVEFERERFGCDHAELGAALAERWSFPPQIVEVIAGHHGSSDETPTPMLDVVMAANFVSKTAGVGLGAEGLNVAIDPEAFDRLGLDEEAFFLVCAEAAGQAAELRQQIDGGGGEA